jgi:hypothetical protein
MTRHLRLGTDRNGRALRVHFHLRLICQRSWPLLMTPPCAPMGRCRCYRMPLEVAAAAIESWSATDGFQARRQEEEGAGAIEPPV